MKKPMEDLLRAALSRRGRAAPAGCLDADTAAAFADDELSAAERSRVDDHVADCGRCQSLLAALVRTTPVPVARVWWRRRAMAWLAPLAVSATAGIVWIAVGRAPLGMPGVADVPPLPTTARTGESSVATPALPSATEPPTNARDAATEAREAPAAAARRDSRGAQPLQAPPSIAAEAVAAPPPTEVPSAGEASALAGERVPSAAPPPASAAPVAPAAAQASAAPADPALERRPAALAETVQVQSSRKQSLASDQRRRETVIVSSDPASRWRIREAVVEHSANGGATWQTQRTGAREFLVAGASPSPLVCWLVGTGGAVVITTDAGRSWQRLTSPAAADLVSIRATDDQSAIVTTADGRTFRTSDRGKTWAR